MTKTRSGRSGTRPNQPGAKISQNPVPNRRHTAAIQIWFSSYFFEKLSPGLKNGLESCPLRFSTISTKNHLLKLNIDKIMAIRVPQMPLPGYPPLYLVGTKGTTAVVSTVGRRYGVPHKLLDCTAPLFRTAGSLCII